LKESKSSYIGIILVYFRAKKITRERQGHFTMIKGPIYQEDLAVLNVCALNNKAAKYEVKSD
jgi:hypothetical protein